jgi:hypothetical protein
MSLLLLFVLTRATVLTRTTQVPDIGTSYVLNQQTNLLHLHSKISQ